MPATESLSETKLQIRRSFSAPREKVFRAWTEPEALKAWCAPSDEYSVPTAEVDLRVGGKYHIAMKAPDGNMYVAVGSYREIQFPEKLVFSWFWEGGDPHETVVTIEFMQKGKGTEMVLTHEFFPNKEQRDRHQHGWEGCTARLENYLEKVA